MNEQSYNKTIKASAIIAILTLSAYLGTQFGTVAANADFKLSRQQAAYTICNSARMEISGYSEKQCGDYLDSHQLDFVCEANNSDPSTHCQVEDISDAK